MRIVVGGALIASTGGVARVLAGQRSAPVDLAGRWEFPGGKVEDGETEAEALVRECREELDVEIAVGGRLGDDVVTATGMVLRVYAASLVSGDPVALEHAQLRWLAAVDLAEVAWLPTNAALLAPLAVLLEERSSRHEDGASATA